MTFCMEAVLDEEGLIHVTCANPHKPPFEQEKRKMIHLVTKLDNRYGKNYDVRVAESDSSHLWSH